LFTHPAFRRVAAGSALLFTVVGLPAVLAAPAEAVPALGSCAATSNGTTLTLTLTADCDTFTPLVVPNGWTVDGAGHKIIAVQDVDHPSFTGGVLTSATGDDTAAATMNAKNLTITSRGFDQFDQDMGSNSLFGIKMVRAGGTFTNVTITNIAHNVGQTSRAFFVSNEEGGSRDVPRANVSLDGVNISRYQKSGLYLSGNLTFDAKNLDVGQSAAVNGTQNTTNAANGVTVINGARGSLSDSLLGHNRYATDDGGPAADVTSATSVLLFNAGRTTLTRNVFRGADGDVGLEIYNDSNSINTVASMTCSTLVRTNGGNGDANQGFGVWNVEDNTPGSVDLTLAANSYSGWTRNVQGASTAGSDPACTTGNLLSSSAAQLVAGSAATLRGTVRNGDGSAATGTATLQRRENGSSAWTAAGTTATATNGSYAFRVAPLKLTSYRTVFAGENFTGSTSNVLAVKVAPKVSIKTNRATVKRHRLATFTGAVGPALPGYAATLQRLTRNGWVNLARTTVSSASTYQFTWRAPRFKGNRYFRVVTTATRNHTNGFSQAVKVRVVR
jgi:hypothetical protein